METATMQDTSDIDLVNKDIFELMGLQDISAKEREDMLITMIETVQNRMLARVADSFEADELDRLQELFEKKDNKAIDEMFAAKGLPDFVALTAQEFFVYKLDI